MTKKKGFRGAIFGLKFILIAALVLVIIVLTGISPLFNISRIEVNGNINCKSDAIIDMSGLQTGVNGFKAIGPEPLDIVRLRFGKSEGNIIKGCPYVKSITAKYLLPGSIRISIVERTPIGVVPYLGTSLLIDGEGYVLDTAGDESSENLPVIKGLKFDDYELGKQLEPHNPESREVLIEIMKALSEVDNKEEVHILGLVNSLDVSDTDNVYISLDSRVMVRLGSLKDLNYRIKAMRQIFMKNIKKDERGLLDFSVSGNPVFTPER